MMLSKYVLSLDYIDKTQLQMSIRCLRDLSFNMFPLVLVLSFQKKKKKKGKNIALDNQIKLSSIKQSGQRSLNSLKTPRIFLNSYFSMNSLNFPCILFLIVLLNILCWILVPKFVWSTCAHQRSLTSVIYAHKKYFPFLI